MVEQTHSFRLLRCPWAKGDDCFKYHDFEWSVPVYEDWRLFKFLILGVVQVGLSWSTILKKRENYRSTLTQFNPIVIAKYGKKKVEALLANLGIVRNRLKIESIVQNANAFLAVQGECDSFDEYIWRFVGRKPNHNSWREMEVCPTARLNPAS